MTDRVEEYLRKRNAEAAARPSPLLSDAHQAARAAAGPRPTLTGDLVADYLALERWKQCRNPDPYGLRR